MNPKFLLTALIALMVTLNGCVKPGEEGPENGTNSDKFTEMKVPANFDWKTSTDVLCNFTSGHDAKVYVSTAEGEDPFASFIVGDDVDPVKVNIPKWISTLYVTYETATGFSTPTAVNVTNNTVTFNVPAESKEYIAKSVSSQFIQTKDRNNGNGNGNGNNYDSEVYYPARANGWGTLMFEDLWPAYGDYDFNDLVVNYKVHLFMQNKNKVNDMIIELRVKAVGGTLPYDLGLSILEITSKDIKSIELVSKSNSALSSVEMVHVNADKGDRSEPPVFLFKDIKTNTKKPQGVAYLNTSPEKEARIADEDLVEVNFYVEFHNPIDLVDHLSYSSFDFFIAREQENSPNTWKEIHVGGYAPTKYGATVYESLKTGNPYIGESKVYYYSNTNLIWGLSIPSDIPHAYEGIDFTQAYPNFKEWATSAGGSNQSWYEDTPGNRAPDSLVP